MKNGKKKKKRKRKRLKMQLLLTFFVTLIYFEAAAFEKLYFEND